MAQSTDPFELFDELLHARREARPDVELRRPATVARVPDQLEDLFDLLPNLPPASGHVPAVQDRPAPPVASNLPAPVVQAAPLRTTAAATPTSPDMSDRDREIRAIVAAAETQIATLRAQLQGQRKPRRARSIVALLALTSLLLSAVTVVVLSRRVEVLPEVPNPASAFDTPAALTTAPSPEPAPALEPAEGPLVEPPRRSSVPISPAGIDSPDTTAAPRPTGTAGQSSTERARSLLSASEQYLTRDAELVMQVKPQLPEGARERGETGVVQVDLTVDDLGRVAQAIAISGPEALRSAAETAARQWRFKPALRVGQPIESQRRVEVTFE